MEVHELLSAKFAATTDEVGGSIEEVVDYIDQEIEDVTDYIDDEIEKVYDSFSIFTIVKRFDFGDASPKSMVKFAEPVLIRVANITLIVPFDKPSFLTVGTTTNPSLLMDSTDINTQEGLIYQTTPGLEVPIDTEIFLTITAGSSAAGTGYLFIEYTPQVA